jgi:hypothetical protein
MIPFVIDMMNSVHSLSTNLPTEFIPSVYTEGIFSSVKSLGNLPMEIFPR